MFKLPTKLRIGPTHYTASKGELSDLMGKCDGDKAYIKIDADVPENKVAIVLFHEILHAMLHEYHVDLPDKTEERTVRALESAFVGFAKDHQKLFQSIVKEMER